MDFSGTFDTTNALSSMFLWLIFGFLAGIINCDLQRFIQQKPIYFHLFGIVAFFFLFALLDTKNTSSIWIIWFKTVFIYGLFLLMTKSKWYFVVPVLILLLLDQMFKKNLTIIEARGDRVPDKKREQQKQVSKFINILIIVVILVGTFHYMWLQQIEYKDKFSFNTFFFGVTRCKKEMPNYGVLDAK